MKQGANEAKAGRGGEGRGEQKLRHRGNENDKAGRGETGRKLWKSGENEETGVCV